MDIRYLGLSILVASVAYYFVPVDNKNISNGKDEIAQVIFENPLMYTLNEIEVDNIIKASNAVRYETRDELFNATIFLKSKNPDEYKLEKLSADFMKKTGTNYYLKDNVNYQRDDFLNLDTNEMYYNDLKKTAKNNVPYSGYYYKNDFKGSHLDFDMNKSYLQSKNVHFEIDMNKGVK